MNVNVTKTQNGCVPVSILDVHKSEQFFCVLLMAMIAKELSLTIYSTDLISQLSPIEAGHKIKSVSCPAGGRNHGQSGGHNFFSTFFFL